MQAKDIKKQAAAKARSAALTPDQRSKIAAKAALKKAGYPSAEYVGTLSLGAHKYRVLSLITKNELSGNEKLLVF